LGDKGFIERVREKLGDKARVEEAKPESRRVFALGIEEIARATAREYGKQLEDLREKGSRRRERGAFDGDLHVSAVGRAQARRDWQGDGVGEDLIG